MNKNFLAVRTIGAIALVVFNLNLFSAEVGKFCNPINNGADPWLTYFDGQYYLTTTQGDVIRMWKSPTLAGLSAAAPILVWKDSNKSRSAGIWAPEFHYLSNHWYMYYTATSEDESDDNHRLYVLESKGSDPTGPYVYKARLFNPTNDHYAIDPTVFRNEKDGKLYFLWAARPGHVLYIARMANPYTLLGNGVNLPADGFGCAAVREAPEVLQRNGKIYLIYSMCAADTPDYKLGMLIADQSSNLSDPASWKQYPAPVFERSDTNSAFGPGHNGFFRSPDGSEDWIVYHAKTSSTNSYADRITRAQKFSWASNGIPEFGVPVKLGEFLDEPSGTKAPK